MSATIETERVESAPASPSMTRAAEALFEEARRRARRRRRRRAAVLAGILVLVAAAAAILLGSSRGDRAVRDRQPAPTAVSPEQALARPPYMGVACRQPNSIACDRVGLAVWTRRFARGVRATIAGRELQLDDPSWSGESRHGLRRLFAGFLHHAGLRGRGPLAVRVENGHNRWTGVHPVELRVRLLITYADGSQLTTTVRTGLSPGWG